jgi:hypothetical protein
VRAPRQHEGPVNAGQLHPLTPGSPFDAWVWKAVPTFGDELRSELFLLCAKQQWHVTGPTVPRSDHWLKQELSTALLIAKKYAKSPQLQPCQEVLQMMPSSLQIPSWAMHGTLGTHLPMLQSLEALVKSQALKSLQ